MSRGFFVTLEGLDGSGKTTQLRLLAPWLKSLGHDVVTLRNPGSTGLGERVREILLDSQAEAAFGSIAPLAELGLMFADRAQSIAEVILPALTRGAIVLCDRFTDSSEAYQGGGRGLGSERVLALHRALCEDLRPDLTVLLLPPLQTALARARLRDDAVAAGNGVDENRFEREQETFYERVHAAYETIAARAPERVVVIRDDAEIDVIQERLRGIVQTRLAEGRL